MTDQILNWLYGAGVAQGIFLVFALARLKVRDESVRWLLIILIALFALLLAPEWLGPDEGRPPLQIALVIEMLLAPLLYLFVRAVRGQPVTGRQVWQFFPFLIAIGVISLINLLNDSGHLPFDPNTRPVIASVILFKCLYFLGYSAVLLKAPLARADQSAPKRQALNWVRRWLFFFYAIYVLAALQFAAFFFNVPYFTDSDSIGAILLSGSIFALGYFALVNRYVLDARPDHRHNSAQDREITDLRVRAQRLLEAEPLYRNPDLTLRQFATALGAREAQLSIALNSEADGGFYALLNQHRLDAFMRSLATHADRNAPILNLAFDAGFNSKTTFYRLFKARYGITPLAWRAEHACPTEPGGTRRDAEIPSQKHSVYNILKNFPRQMRAGIPIGTTAVPLNSNLPKT
jgi:AraC-like DNA-binding protein